MEQLNRSDRHGQLTCRHKMNSLSSSGRELVSESSIKPHHRARESADTLGIDCISSDETFGLLKLIGELFAGRWQEVRNGNLQNTRRNRLVNLGKFMLAVRLHVPFDGCLRLPYHQSTINMSGLMGDSSSISDLSSGTSSKTTGYKRDQSFYYENIVFLVSYF